MGARKIFGRTAAYGRPRGSLEKNNPGQPETQPAQPRAVQVRSR